jgi:hypothetical protein
MTEELALVVVIGLGPCARDCTRKTSPGPLDPAGAAGRQESLGRGRRSDRGAARETRSPG